MEVQGLPEGLGFHSEWHEDSDQRTNQAYDLRSGPLRGEERGWGVRQDGRWQPLRTQAEGPKTGGDWAGKSEPSHSGAQAAGIS